MKVHIFIFECIKQNINILILIYLRNKEKFSYEENSWAFITQP